MSTALMAMGIVILVCALLRFSIVLMMFSCKNSDRSWV